MRRLALTSVLLAVTVVTAAAMADTLDCRADGRLLDSHFGRYGHQPTRTISRSGDGIRIALPALSQTVPQTGLYSYFSAAGDFEVSAAYEVIDMSPPTGGYGKSCGIAVETPGPADMISVARGVQVGNGPGYIVTRGHRADGPVIYESTHYPSKAKAGRLVLRREKADMVCLAADGPQGDLWELVRLPFTPATVAKVRLFADPGESHGSVDARFTQVQVRAVEIAGGVAKYEPPRPWSRWWWAGLSGAGVLGAGVATLRYRTGRWLWCRGDD